MNVTLLRCTPDALQLLLATKNTRLATDEDPATWSTEKQMDHLAYMQDTIKSSWEFVDYTFRIEGVTRAFTHQLVRSRTGSYAQETQRALDVSERQPIVPDSILQDEVARVFWDAGVQAMMDNYADLIEHGTPIQDARGLLPTNIPTSIICKFNLRSLHDMAKLRLCVRTQGEYQNVFKAMRALVIEVHPWAAPFIRVACAADGVCAFPRHRDCPIKPGVFDANTGGVFGPDCTPSRLGVLGARARPVSKDEQQARWEELQTFETNPIVKDGKTM